MEGTSLVAWMAWTWPTAGFFAFVFFCLASMSAWEYHVPGGAPRRGILRLDTTRGDRLFISLLSAAYVHLIWLALVPAPLWGATLLSAALAVLVFRKV